MQVAFEKDSHYFWTVGKDRLLKYWDGDRVSHIREKSSMKLMIGYSLS